LVSDAFVHDRKTGTTTRVSVDSAGNEADPLGVNPAISANGRFVAFAGRVDVEGTLTAGVFVHDRHTGTTTIASVDSAGNAGNRFSNLPSLSRLLTKYFEAPESTPSTVPTRKNRNVFAVRDFPGAWEIYLDVTLSAPC
jgi:hypothetical protein